MHRRFELPSSLHYVAREVCFPFQDGGVEVTRFKKYILFDASRVFRENQTHTGITAFGGQDVFLIPVIKITGNRVTWAKLKDHMDLSVHAVIEGEETLPSAGKRIFDEILEVSSGKMTKAEILGYNKAMDIYTVGPVI